MSPRVEPNHTGTLVRPDGQSVYWEESGSPGGIPAVYLHGGPGGALGPGGYVTRFDTTRYRVIGLDQRGCGRSTPLANDPAHDLSHNTTRHLIDDIEALREHLGVEAWVVNGASWGSTLALAYALAHPHRVLGIVLFAVTTGGRPEIEWITETVGAIYPEAWDRLATYAESAGIGYRRGEGRIVEAYAALTRSPDGDTRRAAAEAWTEWEDTHISIGVDGYQRDPVWDDPTYMEVFATLVTHYWSQDCFVDPPILDRVTEIAHLPAYLIHGRKDVSGPMITPWRLHRAWPGSELVVDEGDGHGGAGMVEAWADANSRLADRLTTGGAQ